MENISFVANNAFQTFRTRRLLSYKSYGFLLTGGIPNFWIGNQSRNHFILSKIEGATVL